MTKHSKPSSWTRDLLIVAALALALPLATGLFLVYRIDTAALRGSVAALLSEKTGRTVALDGEIGWSFEASTGLSLSVSNVSIGNPPWASQPRMAQIGRMKLDVAFWPLFRKKINIIAFDIDQADVMLESHADGRVNWSLAKPKPAQPQETKQEAQPQEAAMPVDVNIKTVSIRNSRFGHKNKKGEIAVFDVPNLVLSARGTQLHLDYKGTVAGLPATLALVGARADQVMGQSWPFNAQLVLGDIVFDAAGQLKDKLSKVVFETYRVTAGASEIMGKATLKLDGARPYLEGRLASPALDPKDFALPAPASAQTEGPASSEERAAAPASSRLFSDEALDVSALGAIDGALEIAVDSLSLPGLPVTELRAEAALAAGLLSLPAIKGKLAGNPFEATLRLDSAPALPDLKTSLRAKDVNLGSFIKIGDFESPFQGKGDVDVKLETRGRSPREMASYANGHINLLMDTGTFSTGTLKSIAGSLLDLFMPGMSELMDTGINCLAARYTLTQGLMETKGLLIDTPATTISGAGYANLADERINMTLYTRPKGVGLSSLVPSMTIQGALASPHFTMDTTDALSTVKNMISGATPDNGVPTLVKLEGKNACAATLDHPELTRAQAARKPVLTPSSKNGLADKVNSLIKGLGGGLFKQ